MLAINEILQWAADNGYANMYGNPAHINRMMHDTDFAASAEQTAVYCYLITAAETMEARDRVTVGVFFARLCDFDFDPKGLLTVQMALMDTAKRMLSDLTAGNVIGYDDPVRWQFGYDDFAENVAWVCARVTFMDLAADCVPMPIPTVEVVSVPSIVLSFMETFGLTATTHDNIVSATDGTYIFFGASVVSESDLSNYTATIMENGTELTNLYYEVQVVDAAIIANIPALADYEGWFWALVFSNDEVAYQSGTYEVAVSIGDIWTATATWEEA